MILSSINLIYKLLKPRKGMVFSVPVPSRMDARDIEKAFARTFATTEGQKVLAHLNGLTFMRAAGMDVPDQSLRYMEGQRALLATILRLIERGRSGQRITN